MFTIRRETHPRQYPHRSNGLLVIPLYRIGQPFFITGSQVTEYKTRFIFKPAAIDKPFSVFGKDGGKAAAITGGNNRNLAVLPVIPANLILRQVCIIVPGTNPPREINIPAIGAKGRIDGLQRWRSADQLNAAAAVLMNHI